MMSLMLAMPFVLFQFSVRPVGAAAVAPPSTPTNGYVAENGVTNYVAEDNATFYVQEM